MDDRKEAEKHFHDHLREELPFQRYTREAEDELSSDPRWSNLKFYSIERKSRAYVEKWIRARCEGKKILDYGCGNGEDALFAAENGATAVGIDISEVSIANCQRSATERGLSTRTSFQVMDAEHLEFEDNSFDLVVVYGVLHHLDFAAAMGEISRVLKPNGQAICTEALAHNPLIHAYRKRTLELRTPWEVDHIMRRKNIQMASRWFEGVNTRFYHLATIAAVPFRRVPGFSLLLSALEGTDALLLRLPWLRWQAWQVVFELSKPRKTPTMS
ncbi:MAG: class I SAM-dependent methyltransferase [Chloroflexi bacterium]|nr:class I SAM-dependent methyltransferase [Chloroflexota bacterium]